MARILALLGGFWGWLLGTPLGREVLGVVVSLIACTVLTVAFAAHYEHKGEAKQAAKDAAVIAGKDKALHAAAIALDGASVALQQQNEENERELLRARQAEADYNTAANVALQAQDAAQKRLQGFDRALQDARAHPSCAALLDADLLKACGL